MPYFKSSTEWFEQSSLLLKARPTTARVTSKYTVLRPSPSKVRKRQKYSGKRSQDATVKAAIESHHAATQNPEELIATFTLKTYDPVSGTCLQYETNKAAEVGRLVGSLGRLGRHMAALPEVIEDLNLPAGAGGMSTPTVEKDENAGTSIAGDQKAAGGGGKKKKKAKK